VIEIMMIKSQSVKFNFQGKSSSSLQFIKAERGRNEKKNLVFISSFSLFTLHVDHEQGQDLCLLEHHKLVCMPPVAHTLHDGELVSSELR